MREKPRICLSWLTSKFSTFDITQPRPSTNATVPAATNTIDTSGFLSVGELEDLLHYLAHRRQRIELTALHLVQEAAQLGISLDRALEVGFRPARSDREHLAPQVLAASLLQPSVRLEMRAMLGDLL